MSIPDTVDGNCSYIKVELPVSSIAVMKVLMPRGFGFPDCGL
jgi:hypothetical protein